MNNSKRSPQMKCYLQRCAQKEESEGDGSGTSTQRRRAALYCEEVRMAHPLRRFSNPEIAIAQALQWKFAPCKPGIEFAVDQRCAPPLLARAYRKQLANAGAERC
jgi:hypothetical protein